jgi:pyruvate ferredoxin oxidoreductase alpha subunit
MCQVNPDVVAAYPITPQTALMEEFSTYVANGLVDTELVRVESEHSSMSACIGASAAGARVMTATSSQGLALMWEMLYIAASMRLPIVMVNVNRALSAPINIHCDHSDSMGARDTGWIQIYSENAQEAYDNTLQAVRIAENMQIRLPVMVCMDGFITSHGIDRVEVLADDTVKRFVGEFKHQYSLLDTMNPVTMGPFALPDYYFEFKRMQAEVMKRVKSVVKKVGQEYGEISGRSYGYFEPYQMEDAEIAMVTLGSLGGTTKTVVDKLREQNIKAGLVKLRLFRPFPAEEIVEVLSRLKAVAVMDRADTLSNLGGPLFVDIQSALFNMGERPVLLNYIYGLGGRDVGIYDVMKVFSDLEDVVSGKEGIKQVNYLGVRE